MASKTFIKITNKDIYNKLCSIEDSLSKIKSTTFWHTCAIAVLFAAVAIMIKALI